MIRGLLSRRYSKIEAFAKEMGVDFYPAGRGIGHQASHKKPVPYSAVGPRSPLAAN